VCGSLPVSAPDSADNGYQAWPQSTTPPVGHDATSYLQLVDPSSNDANLSSPDAMTSAQAQGYLDLVA